MVAASKEAEVAKESVTAVVGSAGSGVGSERGEIEEEEWSPNCFRA